MACTGDGLFGGDHVTWRVAEQIEPPLAVVCGARTVMSFPCLNILRGVFL